MSEGNKLKNLLLFLSRLKAAEGSEPRFMKEEEEEEEEEESSEEEEEELSPEEQGEPRHLLDLNLIIGYNCHHWDGQMFILLLRQNSAIH